MIVKHAKAVARQWVLEEAGALPGFRGAFFHGSMTWLPETAALPATSDVDVMVVLAEPSPPVKLGKILYRDVILDVSYLPSDLLQSADLILGQYHLAGSFWAPSVISDPTGQLTALQTAVSKDYAKRQWVYRRCDHARDKVLQHLQSLSESEPFHDQVTAWLFATGVMTHMLLVAGLRNPTVRRRYLATQELLADYGLLESYETLLELLGCARMTRTRVEHHLATLADVFDAAKAVVKTPFFFTSDISDLARPIAIEGSYELIERGNHREAIFWIAATYARCQKVLYHDAPLEVQERFDPGFRDLLNDLGISSPADLQRRGEQVKASLPWVWEVAEAVIAANRDIDDEQGADRSCRSKPASAARSHGRPSAAVSTP